ncbi:MAG: hypothetical protein JNL85_07085 [Rubrivivax sp.]|nr:hypothetical protein [Rubrivivax sp.]
MKRRGWLHAAALAALHAAALAAAMVAGLGAAPRQAGAAPREVHGAHDAWAGPSLALAWGVLRGRDEATTRVVIRIEADPQRHARVTATGRDPFGGGTVTLPVQRGADGALTIDVPRSHFADHPRTELRFHAPGASGAADADPALLVYFQGVPDTTPESTSMAQLEADLRARIARARAQVPPPPAR